MDGQQYITRSDKPHDSAPRGFFIRVPKWWRTSGALSVMADKCAYGHVVLDVLIEHVNEQEQVAWTSDKFLAEQSRCSETTVKSALAIAQQLGMIDRKPRKYRRSDGRWCEGRSFAIVENEPRHVSRQHDRRPDDSRPDDPRRGDSRHDAPELEINRFSREAQRTSSISPSAQRTQSNSAQVAAPTPANCIDFDAAAAELAALKKQFPNLHDRLAYMASQREVQQ